jgi:hypothetical protein
MLASRTQTAVFRPRVVLREPSIIGIRFLTWRSSAQIWAELHERAVRHLGGTPRLILLD